MEQNPYSESNYSSQIEIQPSIDPKLQAPYKKRYLSIDAFRGLVLVTLVFVNTVNAFPSMPTWTRSTPNWGLTYVDLLTPFIIFAIGLLYHMNYIKARHNNGARQANIRFLKRYLTFVGMGFLFWTPYHMIKAGTLQPIYEWDILQSIGLAGVIALLFINLPRIWRLICGIAGWVVYQWCFITFNLGAINLSENNGSYYSGIGYGILLVLATSIAESFETGKMKDFLIAGLIFTIAGYITGLFWGISPAQLTGPFIFVSLGLACLLFYVVWLIYDHWKITKNTSKLFQPMGKNPLILHVFRWAITLDTLELLLPHYPDTPWYLLTIIGLINILIIWRIGVWMDNRHIYITF